MKSEITGRRNQRGMERVKRVRRRRSRRRVSAAALEAQLLLSPTRRLTFSLTRSLSLTDNSPWLPSARDPTPSSGRWQMIGRCSTALHCR